MSGRACRRAALALVVMLAGCGHPPYPRGSLDQLYPQPPRPTLRQATFDGIALHWAEIGEGTRPLLFIHGSPGDWQAWAGYLDHPALTGYGPRRAVDRPGFGAAAPVPVMTDLRAQAAHLAALLPADAPSILVGHSLGGPLVAWMALDFPERVCGGVVVAGALAPALEAPRWYNRAAEWAAIRRWLPAALRRSNEEMLALQPQLQRLDAEWHRLQRPLRLLQGMKDELVDPRTADHAEARLPAAWVTVERHPEAGHFLLWTQPETVIAAIRALPC
jgi:pimeloyl-ACP methyl ester carboxylesterase